MSTPVFVLLVLGYAGLEASLAVYRGGGDTGPGGSLWAWRTAFVLVTFISFMSGWPAFPL